MMRWCPLVVLLALGGCASPAASVPPASAPRASPALPAAPPCAAAPCANVSAAPAIAADEAPGDPYEGVDDGLDGQGDDDAGDAESAPRPPPRAEAPALALDDRAFEARFRADPASLGSMSVGRASAGLLLNGVQMPKGERWDLVNPAHAWGTRETVDALTLCIDRVNERFPGSPPIVIGHLSAKGGGHLSPHVSHQSGRDADVGFYYRSGRRPFVRATADNLDPARTWALMRAALLETDVEMILVDTSIQRLLVDHAVKSGEDPAFLDRVFQVRGKNPRAPVRYARGHNNHLHFRFHNPIAEELGQRVARFVPPPRPASPSSRPAATIGYAQHRARSGDTLVILAKRYGTTVEEIQRANGLSTNAIRAGVVYRIPQKIAPKSAGGRPGTVARRAPARPHGPSPQHR